MKTQIALTTLTLALISNSVFAEERSGGSARRCAAEPAYTISAVVDRHSTLSPSTSPVSVLVKDALTDTLNALHNSLTIDLNAKIDAAMNRSLQASI